MSLLSAIAGEVPGKKIVSGSFTPAAGTGTETVTALNKIDHVVLVMRDVDLTHMWTTADPAGGNANQFTWAADKPTTNLDTTPIAATTPWNAVDYIAIGRARTEGGGAGA